MKIENLIGEGTELTPLQMGIRAVIVFLLALLFLRLGRRSFGIGSPFDHVTGMLLGAILSRAVVGASPFVATICAGCVIALMHKLLAWISLHSRTFGKIMKGEPKVIYHEGQVIRKNMNQCLITDNDLLEGLRECGNVESLEEIKKAYIERDGKISIIKQTKPNTAK
jgi:uncharacterized membrane protein YcaP (DUF421 family)